jgi:pilus assembly protein Flp/PilA
MTSKITKLFVDASIRLRGEDTGATAVEYGLIVGLIAAVIIVAVTLLGNNILGMFNTINTNLAP